MLSRFSAQREVGCPFSVAHEYAADFLREFEDTPLVAGSYVPVPAGANFNSVPHQLNKIANNAAGLSQAFLPGVGALPDNVLVSGFGTGPGFCD